MTILVINAGSSSLKYQLFEMKGETTLAGGKIERIGMDAAIITHRLMNTGAEINHVSEILSHTEAIRTVLDHLTHPEHGVLGYVGEIDAVGHRVVHGGEAFTGPVRVNAAVKREIKRLYDLAPLHNPAHMTGIMAVETNMPDVPQAAVFDTSFHQTMPEKAYLYAIPSVFYKKHGVRRYGFHGISHEYVSGRAAAILHQPLERLKLISCHMGNGASCTAIMNGRSLDTSMGMTPLEGLMMGTRSGDLDPAIVPFAMAKEDLTIGEASSMLNKHSGLLAVSGTSGDAREIEEAMLAGDRKAQLAFDMYEYRLRKYIGAYTAAMNGLDALIFTAGVGENSSLLRQRVCGQLSFFGVRLDEAANNQPSNAERIISAQDSKAAVLVIPTNEELMIARATAALLRAEGLSV